MPTPALGACREIRLCLPEPAPAPDSAPGLARKRERLFRAREREREREWENSHFSDRLLASRILASAVVGLSLLAAQPLRAATPDPLELMRQSDKRHRLAAERTVGTMTLQEKNGEPRSRTFESIAVQDDARGDKTRIVFSAPADIKDTTLLSIETADGKDTEQWLYLPAFRKTRRLGASELGDRFVGSDLFFEDMQRREVDDYAYTLTGAERVDGADCYIIEAVPKAPKVVKESPYGKSQMWLRKDNLVVVRAKISDRRLRPLKEVVVEGLRQVRGDVWRADKMIIVDVQRQHRTVMTTTERDISYVPPENVFNSRQLGSR